MRIGSLFSGAGGLDMAVEAVFGGETVWHCELDKAASKVLAHRWPGVPNYHDITAVDWATVEPVDILCGGWPCQPFSLAGKRKGAEDERALWPYVARTIRLVRPRHVVLENVSAVLTAGEFQRVADSLAQAGYEFAWICVRASDIGAPHRRERLFIVAHAVDARPCGSQDGTCGREPDTVGRDLQSGGGRRQTAHAADSAGLLETGGQLLPTPVAHDGKGTGPSAYNRRTPDLQSINHYLPTPQARDWKGGQSNQYDLNDAVLLPTPRTSDTNGAGPHGDAGPNLRTTVSLTTQWGKYAPTIRRWEHIVGPAPAPTEPNRNGNPRLNPAFSEWMMGWPFGWVTDVPGLSRSDQLRIIGNGVVPQCAAAALRYLLSVSEVAA